MKMTARITILITLAAIVVAFILPVTGCGVAKDSQLQWKIHDELKKHRDVQHDKLTINVRDGVVSISGELYTREEIDRVVEIVSAIDGVVQVRNHMTLPDDWQTHNPTFLYPF